MEQQVMYKYNKMELEQFAMFEENYNSTAEVQCQTETQFSFDKEHSILCCRITINMLQDNNLILKSELKSYFDIKPESIEGLRKDNRILFAPPLLVQFASLCYGSMRGVIYAKTIGNPLNNIILPPIYFGHLIDKSFVVER
jgi:hypothetical protein